MKDIKIRDLCEAWCIPLDDILDDIGEISDEQHQILANWPEKGEKQC